MNNRVAQIRTTPERSLPTPRIYCGFEGNAGRDARQVVQKCAGEPGAFRGLFFGLPATLVLWALLIYITIN